MNDAFIGAERHLEFIVLENRMRTDRDDLAGPTREIDQPFVANNDLDFSRLLLSVFERDEVDQALRRIWLQAELRTRHERAEQRIQRALLELRRLVQRFQSNAEHPIGIKVFRKNLFDRVLVGLEEIQNCRAAGLGSSQAPLFLQFRVYLTSGHHRGPLSWR